MNHLEEIESDRSQRVEIMKQPVCHFTPMDFEWADDWPNGEVEFWICRHCGHTKEICRHQVDMKEKEREAPWKDFAGKRLYEGDTIKHPSGESGVIEFHHEAGDSESDQWKVSYNGGKSLSRLCLQIGDKGQAVKVNPTP